MLDNKVRNKIILCSKCTLRENIIAVWCMYIKGKKIIYMYTGPMLQDYTPGDPLRKKF